MKARGLRRNRHLRDHLLYRGEQHTCAAKVKLEVLAKNGPQETETPKSMSEKA